MDVLSAVVFRLRLKNGSALFIDTGVAGQYNMSQLQSYHTLVGWIFVGMQYSYQSVTLGHQVGCSFCHHPAEIQDIFLKQRNERME